MLCGDLNGKEIQRGDVCIHVFDSLSCIAEGAQLMPCDDLERWDGAGGSEA